METELWVGKHSILGLWFSSKQSHAFSMNTDSALRCSLSHGSLPRAGRAFWLNLSRFMVLVALFARSGFAASPAAESKGRWCFQPIAQVTPPKPRRTAWVRNPIDGFILAKLEEKNLTPAP